MKYLYYSWRSAANKATLLAQKHGQAYLTTMHSHSEGADIEIEIFVASTAPCKYMAGVYGRDYYRTGYLEVIKGY